MTERVNQVAAVISGSIVSGVIGFFIATYSANYGSQLSAQSNAISAQSAELRAHDLDISDLKSSRISDERDISSMKLDVKALGQLAVQLGELKQSVDGQTEAIHALQTRVENMGDWIRPIHPVEPPR